MRGGGERSWFRKRRREKKSEWWGEDEECLRTTVSAHRVVLPSTVSLRPVLLRFLFLSWIFFSSVIPPPPPLFFLTVTVFPRSVFTAVFLQRCTCSPLLSCLVTPFVLQEAWCKNLCWGMFQKKSHGARTFVQQSLTKPDSSQEMCCDWLTATSNCRSISLELSCCFLFLFLITFLCC